MSRSLTAAVLAFAFAVSTGSALLAIRSKPDEGASASRKAPEALAAEALASGLKRLENAERVEAGNPKQARRDYENALKDFQRAAKLQPENYRAHNGIGYSYRKLGNYERALAAYEQALTLAPTFTDAIEYRAEAYLGLNRLEDAKQAYMHLFVNDRRSAGVLMTAMKAWVEKRRAAPAGVDAATLDAFAAWVHERDTLAASVLNLGHNSPDWK